jgi:hypothetical protein
MAAPCSYFREHGSMAARLVPEFCGRHNSRGCCFGYEKNTTQGDKEGAREKETRTKKQMKTDTLKEEMEKKELTREKQNAKEGSIQTLNK